MRANLRGKQNKKLKLISVLCLSIVLSCSNVCAENLLTFKPLPTPIPYKPNNTIQLDSSKIVPIQPKAPTTIPFNLRDFN